MLSIRSYSVLVFALIKVTNSTKTVDPVWNNLPSTEDWAIAPRMFFTGVIGSI